MKVRCPRAKVHAPVTLRNYTLKFNGVASIGRRNGAEVKGVLWDITPECERSLDRYEGYPRLYGKMNVTVYTDDGEKIRAMVYVMTAEHDKPAIPSRGYYDGIETGFWQNDIPTDTLETALEETYIKIDMLKGGKRHEQIAAW
jgi:gamma-glutamylcyclotransferase (GGCT)/AIG2-like uncharacterized protein YtfP